MTGRRKRLFCTICCFYLVVTGLSAQTLQVIDREGHTTPLEGVSLASLLSSAGVQLGDKLRGPRMTRGDDRGAAGGSRRRLQSSLCPGRTRSGVRGAGHHPRGQAGRQATGRKEGPFRIVAP